MSKISKQLDILRNKIRYHDQKYYVEATPEISDLEYDKLIQQLTELEEQHPELITPDSPTQRIGDRPISTLKQVSHAIPMLSIENTYTIEGLYKFFERTKKLLKQNPKQ